MIPKFRVWDDENKVMWNIERWHVEDEYFDLIEPDKSVVDPNAKRVLRKQSDVTLMQSTCLLDVNGKEVFEGDVVELHHFTKNYSTTGGFYEGEESLVGVVRYGYTDDEIKYFGKVYTPRWFFENRYGQLDFSALGGLHEESFEAADNIIRVRLIENQSLV